MNKLWGGRFNKKSHQLADHFSFSIQYDHVLAKHDVRGSIAHVQMLKQCKIIPKQDADKILAGLKRIDLKIKKGQFLFDSKAEDIHTNIQQMLKKDIGESADKLHTARSRNDQIALDMRLYCREETHNIILLLTTVQKSILSFAITNRDVIIPAYTHLQSAQVVLLAHHMLAYIHMFERDKQRLNDGLKRINVLPLGSCALSGTTLKTNRKILADLLKFDAISCNSMDAVSDRDFVIEMISALSILAMHLSRISEDLVLWASQEFDFINIDASFCTGSSIMPHKKNPDILELIRGTTGKIYGHLMNLLTLMKGLPLTYNRDMQLDKPPLFDSVTSLKEMLNILTELFHSLQINKQSLPGKCDNESFFSVDLMEYLISQGVAYRHAHDIIGQMVKDCLDNGKRISELSLKELKAYSPFFSHQTKDLLNANNSVHRKKSLGSTNPIHVNQQLLKWKKNLHA